MLIFFDIDGTLIDEETHLMPESAREAIEQARKAGHICVINTGRSKKLVDADIDKLEGFDGMLMGCGTMIVYHGEVLLHKTFSKRETELMIEGLRKYQIDACLEGAENNYFDVPERMQNECWKEFASGFAHLHYGTFEDAPGHCDKFYCYAGDKERMDLFMAEYGHNLEYVDRKKGFFEVMPKGYSKASAMDTLADLLGIPMEETAAIGDSSNDIPMIARAHIGIAMGNASADVREIADYVASELQKDGIADALHFLGAAEAPSCR